MPKILSECPVCKKKNVYEKSTFNLGKSKFIGLDCGHSYKQTVSLTDADQIELLDKKRLYPFQVKGVHFSEQSGFSCLIADEQGLGKTIQALGTLHLHLDELKPILIIVKASLTIQWQRHIPVSLEKFAQIVKSKSDLIPGLPLYICSFDTVGKINWDSIKPKTIILDECQMIKNHDAKRTNAIRNLVNKYKIVNRLFYSGTPIENNAIEYWPTLNLLRPQMYPSRDNFCKYEVGYYWDSRGKYKAGGIKNTAGFKDKTKDFIIRRLRKEVFPELPPITRDYQYYDINAEEMQAYSKGVAKLAKFLDENDESSRSSHSDLQGHIMILRHITGLAKIAPTLEFVEEFIENEEERKLAIFHHHIDVGKILQDQLTARNIGLTYITSQMDAQARVDRLDIFRNDNSCRILIAPTLASGTGYDLDFCDFGILLEREWNPSKEGQVEGRFIRATPEVIAKAQRGELKVTMQYPTAVDTVDEFFAELVERKRQNIDETMNGFAESAWNETDIMLQIAKMAVDRWKKAA